MHLSRLTRRRHWQTKQCAVNWYFRAWHTSGIFGANTWRISTTTLRLLVFNTACESSPYYVFSSEGKTYTDAVQDPNCIPRSPSTVFVQMREPSGNTVLTLQQVEALIENGHAIVILGQRVLNLDSWLDSHPGGAKVILHVVGRDATDEINA